MRYLPILLMAVLCLFACENPYPPSCNDGLMNLGEEGVDCGGPCPACNEGHSCFDGIHNGTEVSVDCGGECLPCFGVNLCADGIQNNGEGGVDCDGECDIPCILPCEPDPSLVNTLEGFATLTSVGCGYDASSESYEINAGAGFGSLTIQFSSTGEVPEVGLYQRGTYNLLDPNRNEYSVYYTESFVTYTGSSEYPVYVVSNDPLEVVFCDLKMSGQFGTFDNIKGRIVCD